MNLDISSQRKSFILLVIIFFMISHISCPLCPSIQNTLIFLFLDPGLVQKCCFPWNFFFILEFFFNFQFFAGTLDKSYPPFRAHHNCHCLGKSFCGHFPNLCLRRQPTFLPISPYRSSHFPMSCLFQPCLFLCVQEKLLFSNLRDTCEFYGYNILSIAIVPLIAVCSQPLLQ